MITISNRGQFEKSIIAQDDDNNYSESGFVAVVHEGVAAIASYSHCSCYGTWESLNAGGISDHVDAVDPLKTLWDWSGTPDELVRMAARKSDINFPNRDANPADSDYDHLMAVYEQIIAWDRKRVRLVIQEGDL